MNALTARQREIIELRLQGLRYKQVALRLTIGESTVRSQIQKAYDVLGVCDMRQLRALLAGQEAIAS